MSEVLHYTESVCPECLEKIPASLVRRNDEVLLVKECLEHGSFSTTVWRGEPLFESWVRPKLPYLEGTRQRAGRGCPNDCGLCEHHSQRTCTALVEVTSRCNLQCPVCFADSGGAEPDPDRDMLVGMFDSIIEKTGGCNLQLSGGEPTVRKDLAQIVHMAKKAGFQFIQLNTNGLAFSKDGQLAFRLKEAGLSSVFLQFDGIDDSVYKELRGQPLFKEKCAAIDNLSRAGLGIVLVPTIMRAVNSHCLGDIVRFGLEHQPHVRGVHFQPISFFGRFPDSFSPDHVTLPEIMRNLARQSRGQIRVEDFHPPGCEHALCSFSAKYLMTEDGTLQRLGSKSCDCTPIPAEEGALKSIGVTARQWGGVDPLPLAGEESNDDLTRFIYRVRNHSFSISAMAFQDCWNLNLERLAGCCIHVAQPDGRLIPFCSYNLTARNGRPLYRRLIEQQRMMA